MTADDIEADAESRAHLSVLAEELETIVLPLSPDEEDEVRCIAGRLAAIAEGPQ